MHRLSQSNLSEHDHHQWGHRFHYRLGSRWDLPTQIDICTNSDVSFSLGIGKATALSLAKYGVNKLVLADIQTQKLEETANLIREKYPAVEVLALKVDVANEEEIKFGISEAVKFGGGRLDYAINNAAFEEPGLMTHEIPDEAFDRQIKVDLYGVWRCQKAEITAMLNQEDKGPREGRGRIINLSSAHGIVGSSPRDFNTPYSIAKHGKSISSLSTTQNIMLSEEY